MTKKNKDGFMKKLSEELSRVGYAVRTFKSLIMERYAQRTLPDYLTENKH